MLSSSSSPCLWLASQASAVFFFFFFSSSPKLISDVFHVRVFFVGVFQEHIPICIYLSISAATLGPCYSSASRNQSEKTALSSPSICIHFLVSPPHSNVYFICTSSLIHRHSFPHPSESRNLQSTHLRVSSLVD